MDLSTAIGKFSDECLNLSFGIYMSNEKTKV